MDFHASTGPGDETSSDQHEVREQATHQTEQATKDDVPLSVLKMRRGPFELPPFAQTGRGADRSNSTFCSGTIGAMVTEQQGCKVHVHLTEIKRNHTTTPPEVCRRYIL